ncbi:MAG: 1-acyl-sn-glycerol-3-phosphate acyltransferase [Candidatus Bipolaricaulota bacterium]|nr:MAG: 1-acyl-sn-glycerol-3-phosphate acyltransferase [Candidatus Bipolaricaulota bacterium]
MTRRCKELLKGFLYWLLVLLVCFLSKVLFRLRVHGRSMIRRGRGYIAVARHRSYWDVLILAAAVGWPNRVHFVARKGLFRKVPLAMPLIHIYSTVIDRDNFRLADYRRLRTAVHRERLVAIFPEGTTRRAVDPKEGAVHFARISGKPLLPINIQPQGPYPPKYPLGFPRVTVSIGEPITVEELEDAAACDPGSDGQGKGSLSDELMARIDAVNHREREEG